MQSFDESSLLVFMACNENEEPVQVGTVHQILPFRSLKWQQCFYGFWIGLEVVSIVEDIRS